MLRRLRIETLERRDLMAAVAGDVNLDGVVNMFDVGLVSERWLRSGPTGDANSDGIVNVQDIGVISMNWLKTGTITKPQPGGVPQGTGAITHDRITPVYSATGKQLTHTAPWMEAVYDTDGPLGGTVETDWLRLWARRSDGTDVLLIEQNYTSGTVGGGLFSRYPWYGTNDYDPMPYQLQSGAVLIRPYVYPDRVFHWWSDIRSALPSGTVTIWSEARVRVTGSAAVQAGFDFMGDASSGPRWVNGRLDNWAEGARSGWAYASPDWQIISAGKPT